MLLGFESLLAGKLADSPFLLSFFVPVAATARLLAGAVVASVEAFLFDKSAVVGSNEACSAFVLLGVAPSFLSKEELVAGWPAGLATACSWVLVLIVELLAEIWVEDGLEVCVFVVGASPDAATACVLGCVLVTPAELPA
jgi:hypothetical protein